MCGGWPVVFIRLLLLYHTVPAAAIISLLSCHFFFNSSF